MATRRLRRLECEIAPGVILVRTPEGTSEVHLAEGAKDFATIDRMRLAAWLAATASERDAQAAIGAARSIEVGQVVDLVGAIGKRLGR